MTVVAWQETIHASGTYMYKLSLLFRYSYAVTDADLPNGIYGQESKLKIMRSVHSDYERGCYSLPRLVYPSPYDYSSSDDYYAAVDEYNCLTSDEHRAEEVDLAYDIYETNEEIQED